MQTYRFAGLRLHAVGEAFRAAVIPLVPLLGLVHLRTPLLLLVLCGAGCRDQGGIDDRGRFNCHAVGLEVPDQINQLFHGSTFFTSPRNRSRMAHLSLIYVVFEELLGDTRSILR